LLAGGGGRRGAVAGRGQGDLVAEPGQCLLVVADEVLAVAAVPLLVVVLAGLGIVLSIRGRHDSDMKSEKQTVEDQRRPAATVANTVAKPLDGARRTWTTLEYRPSPRPVTDDPGRLAHSYGSDARRRDSRDARKSQVTSRMRVVSVAGRSSITCSA